ncbi:hypothetical protein ACJIZ3_018659 [Penstemon smallii]|uniref:K Homology domain-containing protein n=1 Tax=Penstemon smallii TaxID=265156 RepID=A0ABD3SZ16_9LAMI
MAEIDQTYSEIEQAHEHEYPPEQEHDQEYQPEQDHEQEYQPEHEHGQEYQPEQEHEQEYQPEHEHVQEYQPEQEHEQEYQPEQELVHELADVHEQELVHELADVHEHEIEDGIPENSHPDEDHASEPVAGGGEKWPGWPGESIFRMLVHAQKVGSIIGRKGEYIKKTCEETKARIKILDGPPGTRERAVMVSAKEEPDAPLPPAIDGLLRVHQRVVEGLENDSSNPQGSVGKVSTRLLVPAAQAGSLIGKQGTTVKSIQEESNCIVRVLGAEDLPVFALQDDRIVEVVGEPTGVHKAIELIASHLRKFLVDRSIISVIEMQMQRPNLPMEHMPPAQPWGPPPQSFAPNVHARPGYGASPHFMPPPRQFDNYYPPTDMPPRPEKPHQGISAYGREAPLPVHSSSSQAATSVITQVTQQMQIPLSYADAVIGTQGATISYIRRVSGATITIQETRGVPEEMTVEISGTSSQVQTAQQLIQNFMAEAAGPAQTQHGPSADQMYNSYGAHGSVYTSPPSNQNQSGGGGGGGYGSVYGTNYGYIQFNCHVILLLYYNNTKLKVNLDAKERENILHTFFSEIVLLIEILIIFETYFISKKSNHAKSRNFRRRAGDEDDDSSATPSTTAASTTKINATPSTNKTKQPTVKSLLSFADAEDDESPFSRPPPSKPSSSSSSRLSTKSSSAHKLTSSKDRIAPHTSSFSSPSNVQPQAGVYTKEALLELQKNTRTISGPSRSKPKPEPVVILKGLVKPVISNDLETETNGKIQDFGVGELGGLDRKNKTSSVERDDAFARLGKVRLGNHGSREEDEGVIPDQATIEAIRAKRERLRQAKAAAPDFISLDQGSNHGAAEGLSDEEPEFQGRIGLFGEKVGSHDKKGVFEEFEARAMERDRGVESGNEDEDEEDKMWEEEQVRKGLGKRLDDGVGTHGVSISVSGGNSVRQSGPMPSFGYSGAAPSGVYPSVQEFGGSSSIGGAVGGLFGGDVMSIAQQAEVAKKALNESLRRVRESHDRTMLSLAKTDENLSSSLVKVTTLENSLSAADEKFLFMQKLREFVSVICEFLQHKAPFIEELEEQIQKLHEERARAITERRAADNDDELSEIEPAIIAARAEFRKGGSSAAKVAAATVAAQAAFANASSSKSIPVELDEFGRDVNLQKRMDITRRAGARKQRRTKADSKRKLAMEIDNSFQQIEGELSTDESDSETTAYDSTRNQLLQVAEKIFSDAAEEYSQFSVVIERFEKWKKDYALSYRDAYMSLSIPAIFSPYVRLELLKHSLLFDYGLPEDETTMNENEAQADADADLIPDLVDKLAVPILRHQLAFCWDMLSTRETKYAVSAVKLVVRYVDLSSSTLGSELVAVLHDRLTNAVADLMVPTWSPLEMKAVPNAAQVSAYRFGTCVRLMRNICLWNEILSMPVLEKIALEDLLCSKILPHLHSIHSNIHDAITRTERVIASLNGVWSGPSVTGDRSRKLQPLVDYLVLIGKTLEKRYASGGMDIENGKMVRRLKKMLVELNEYDQARALSRTFNLKEAL